MPKVAAVLVRLVPAEGAMCIAEVQGNSYRVPDQEAQLLAALNAARKAADDIHLVGNTDAPWRCVGAVIALAGKAHFGKVGFIAQPSPSDYR